MKSFGVASIEPPWLMSLGVLIVRLELLRRGYPEEMKEQNEFSLRMSNKIWFVNSKNSNIFLREDHLPNVAAHIMMNGRRMAAKVNHSRLLDAAYELAGTSLEREHFRVKYTLFL